MTKLRTDSTEAKTVIRRVAIEVSKLKEEMSEVKDTMATKSGVSAMFSRLHKAVDDFVPLMEATRKDRERSSDAYMQVQRRLDDHGRRLSRLASKPA